MVLRTLLGDGPDARAGDAAVARAHVLVAGIRASTTARTSTSPRAASACSRSTEHRRADALVAAVEATGATSVYLHVDLDVLDPAEFGGLGYPEPFGLSLAALVDAIRRAPRRASRWPVPGSPSSRPASPGARPSDDLATILRILGALTSLGSGLHSPTASPARLGWGA